MPLRACNRVVPAVRAPTRAHHSGALSGRFSGPAHSMTRPEDSPPLAQRACAPPRSARRRADTIAERSRRSFRTSGTIDVPAA